MFIVEITTNNSCKSCKHKVEVLLLCKIRGIWLTWLELQYADKAVWNSKKDWREIQTFEYFLGAEYIIYNLVGLLILDKYLKLH